MKTQLALVLFLMISACLPAVVAPTPPYCTGAGLEYTSATLEVDDFPEICSQQCPEEVYFYDTVGSAGPISISGNILALGGSLTGFHLLDISTPQDPIFLSNVMTFGVDPCPTLVPAIPDVIIADDLLFVTYICPIYRADYSGFKVYDISDPTKPTLIGSYDTVVSDLMGFYNIQIYQQYLYAALGRWGVAAFDISNPERPSKIWHDTEAGSIVKVDVSYPLMTVLNRWGNSGEAVILYDIAIPTQPSRLTSISIGGTLQDIALAKGLLYILVANGQSSGSLQIYDITDLLNIRFLANYDINGMKGTHFANKNGIVSISATDYKAPYPYESSLLILNVRDVENIYLLSSKGMYDFYSDGDGFPSYGDAQYDKKYLYLSGHDGMKIFDVRQCIISHDRPLSKPINEKGIQ